MNLVIAIKTLIEKNVWISISLLVSGIVLFKLSDTSALISFISRLFSAPSYNFVENLFVISGLVSLAASFYTFYVWMIAYDKKRRKKRKLAMQQAAQVMGWSFSEDLSTPLRNQIDSFIVNRALGVPGHLHNTRQNTANFLSTKTSGDLLIIFDFQISAVNDAGDSSADFETVYLVASDNLDLPVVFHNLC